LWPGAAAAAPRICCGPPCAVRIDQISGNRRQMLRRGVAPGVAHLYDYFP